MGNDLGSPLSRTSSLRSNDASDNENVDACEKLEIYLRFSDLLDRNDIKVPSEALRTYIDLLFLSATSESLPHHHHHPSSSRWKCGPRI